MTVDFNGVAYDVPAAEPAQSREPEKLFRPFQEALEAFVRYANARVLPYELRVGECRRSLERQAWLYSLGRGNPGPVRSWTMNSRHRYGLAADLYAVDVATGQAVWDGDVWDEIYRLAPPQLFGLTTIPQERVHLEHAYADVLIARADELGVVMS